MENSTAQIEPEADPFQKTLAVLKSLPLPPPPGEKDASVWDEENPRSVINLVPEKVASAIRGLPHSKFAGFIGLTEFELYKKMGFIDQRPDQTSCKLRFHFWLEYEYCQTNRMDKMAMTRVYGSVISREMFYSYILVNPVKLLWMLTPPQNYLAALEEALLYTTNVLREILDVPHTGRTGRPVPTVISQKIIIAKFLAEQLFGSTPLKNPSLKLQGKFRGYTADEENLEMIEQVRALTEADAKDRLIKLEKKLKESEAVGIAPVEEE